MFGSELQLQKYEVRFHDLQSDLTSSQERNRHSMTELTNREEELMVHKVELSSLQEKLKVKVEEVSQSTPEVYLLSQIFNFHCL